MTKRVCIAGGGAIGSVLAAHLARVTDTWVLTRRAEHARALTIGGLTVSGKAAFTSRPSATADPSQLPPVDVIFMATKATGLEAVATTLEGVSPDATVVTLQNGLGAEDVIRRHGDWRIVSGTTLMGSIRLSETHVEYELDAPTWLAPHADTSTSLSHAEEIGALLVRSGLKAVVFEDLRPAQWSKLVFNAVVATVATLTGVPHSQAMVDTDDFAGLGRLVRDAIEEGKAIAAAAGVELLEDPWKLNVRPIEEGIALGVPYSHPPSMMLDAAIGTPTELEFNVGALARLSGELHVDAPLIVTLYRLMRAKEWNAAISR
jgi:2-dehydropantoate 2-reductase